MSALSKEWTPLTLTHTGPVEAFDSAALRAGLFSHGAVLVRGLRLDPDGFGRLADQLIDRPMWHGGLRSRESQDGTVQSVQEGRDALVLHAEQAYLPRRPDLCFFYCITPALQGGETTLYDGVALADALSDSTRRLLRERGLRHGSRTEPDTWQEVLGATDEPLVTRLGRFAGFSPRLEDRFVHGVFDTAAFFERPGGLAFANSMVAFPDRRASRLVWAELGDGTPFPAEVRAEVEARAAEAEYAHAWQPHELLVLDNWRVMHGRRAFTDPARYVLAKFGYARWCRPTARQADLELLLPTAR